MQFLRLAAGVLAGFGFAGLTLDVPAADASAPPPDYRFKPETLASGLSQPMELELAPDGRIFVNELGGRLRLWKPGASDWLEAGVQDNGDADRDDSFGDGDDRAILGGSDKILSKIASIVIKGQAYGTPRANQGTGIDSFGFLAQQIGSFKVGGTSFPLTPDAGTDLAGLLVGATGDLRVREVAV